MHANRPHVPRDRGEQAAPPPRSCPLYGGSLALSLPAPYNSLPIRARRCLVDDVSRT